MILFSGALLLTPGFFTDAVGFALLVPGVRDFILRRIKERVEVHTVSAGNPHWRPSGPVDGDVIEGEYEVEDPPRRWPFGMDAALRPEAPAARTSADMIRWSRT
jgi:UPF0716 protein FxsA